MAFTHSLTYATEGAPLLIADLPSASAWRGREDDGKGAVVEYMGLGIADLPKDLAAKPGRVSRKFKSLEEARAFEKHVVAEFLKLHPGAARPPQYPDYPGFYVGDERRFAVEVRFTTAFDALIKTHKSTAQLVSTAPNGKSRAIAFAQEGGGPGLCAFDQSASLIVIAKLHYAGDPKGIEAPLAAMKMPRAKETIALDGRVLVFDAAQSASDIARANWNEDSLLDAGARALASDVFAQLRVAGQQAPCVARIHCAKGEYAFAAKADVDLDGVGALVLWLKKLAK